MRDAIATMVATFLRWYGPTIGGTTTLRVGYRGRVVLPANLRQRGNWPEGTRLIAVETERGVILVRREELEQPVRDQLVGTDLVYSLIEERRLAAVDEESV